MTHTELLDELVVLLDNYLNENFEKEDFCEKAMFLQGMREGFDTLNELLKEGTDAHDLLWEYEATILHYLTGELPEQTDEARDY